MDRLPLDEIRGDLAAGWRQARHFVLRAPTGSGKSTRVGRYLLEASGWSEQVWVLQPRRLAARLLAYRAAAELGEVVGERVGYAVHLESRMSARTRLLYLTEGLALRWLLRADALRGVGAVLLDEFHERHLDGEVVLGMLRDAVAGGWAGRIGVMSATLEVEEVAAYLGDVSDFSASGRAYPVEVKYLGGSGNVPLWEAAARGVRAALDDGAEADVLVFLPGKYELRRTAEELAGRSWARGWEVEQLHGEIPLSEQQRLVSGGSGRRIILATNVAETSLTLPAVRTVVDSGLARIPSFDAGRGINRLETCRISLASAQQRAGRAGRVAPGRCYRLWGRAEEERMAPQLLPELQRLDLAGVRLMLSDCGREDGFPWLEDPPSEAWAEAGRLLQLLGATDAGGITPLGRQMAAFGMHPRQSRILLAAVEAGMTDWVLPGLAVLERRGILLSLAERRLEHEREIWLEAADGWSDLLREVLAYRVAEERGFDPGFCRAYGLHWLTLREVREVVAQWSRQLAAMGLRLERRPLDPAAFARVVLRGYVDHLGVRVDRGTARYRRLGGKTGLLRRDSVVGDAELLVSADVLEQERGGAVTLMLGYNTVVRPEWLEEDFPWAFREESVTVLQADTRRVESVRQRCFLDLVLSETRGGEVDPVAAAQCLAKAVLEQGWVLKRWDAAVENWIARLNTLAHWCPELGLSPLQASDRPLLLEHICEGALSYKEIKDREVWPVLRQWVPDALLPLMDEWVPERFVLPGGRTVKLRYEHPQKVILSARIQQLYDVPGSSLKICNGRCPLLVELLAPNQRPVQVTADLDAFWTGQYPQVRKDLFGRYPRHEWR